MIRRPRGLRALVAMAACAVIAPGVAAFGDAASPLRITRPVNASAADVDPGRLYSNPALAVHPTDPMIVVAGFTDYRTRLCGLMRSLDGGTTWTKLDALPAPSDYPWCAQAQGGVVQAPVAFGGKGTLYMALNGWDQQDGGARTGGAILVARSTDLGDTWQTAVAYTARGKTGDAAENVRPVQGLAVHPRGGTDDVVYATFALARTGTQAPNQAPGEPTVVISRDGGRTFGAPVNLAVGVFDDALRAQAFAAVTTTIPSGSGPTTTTTVPPAGSLAAQPDQAGNFGSQRSRNGIMPGVDKQGNVYVLWPSGTANITPAPPSAVMLSKSTDGGATWTTSVAIPFRYDNPRGGPANSYAKFAVTRDGVLHMVYGINPNQTVEGYGEVFHQASTDGGRTWSERRSLTDSSLEAYGAQYFPNLSVAPNGRVDVAWWDVRDDPGVGANDVYYAYSEDDGRTWSKNLRVTDRSVDRRFGVWGRNYDITAQPGVASTDAYAIFGWDDTRANLEPGAHSDGLGAGVQDIYMAAVQFRALGGGTSSTAKAVLAGVVGLIAVGLVLLVVGYAGGRGGPKPVPAGKAEPRSTAAPVS